MIDLKQPKADHCVVNHCVRIKLTESSIDLTAKIEMVLRWRSTR
jgi:hypothetical protein